MKLFVVSRNGTKKYLDRVASTRSELSRILGGDVFSIGDETFYVSQVTAEKGVENAPVSAVIGGALGLVGGMPGVVIGGVLGALLGSDSDQKEKAAIDIFNRS